VSTSLIKLKSNLPTPASNDDGIFAVRNHCSFLSLARANLSQNRSNLIALAKNCAPKRTTTETASGMVRRKLI
jgi:hypothetical protein